MIYIGGVVLNKAREPFRKLAPVLGWRPFVRHMALVVIATVLYIVIREAGLPLTPLLEQIARVVFGR